MHHKHRSAAPRRQRGTTNHDDNSDSALGDIEKLRLERGKPKPLDNDVRKHPEAANNQRARQLEKHIEPCNRVRQRLDKLVPLEPLILDPRFVGAHPLDHELLVFFGETFGFHGAVGEVPPQENGPDAR